MRERTYQSREVARVFNESLRQLELKRHLGFFQLSSQQFTIALWEAHRVYLHSIKKDRDELFKGIDIGREPAYNLDPNLPENEGLENGREDGRGSQHSSPARMWPFIDNNPSAHANSSQSSPSAAQ